MDDKFLYGLRDEPRHGFAPELRARLHRKEQEPALEAARRARFAFAPVVWGGAALAAMLALVLSPSLRASAQSFLDLFRVRNFAAVEVSPARMQQLQALDLDPRTLLGTPEVVHDPGPTRVFEDPAAAQAAAGYTLHLPTDVPWAMRPDTIRVHGEMEQRIRVDTSRLRSLLASLAIDDVTVPAGVDGANLSVRMSPVAGASYHHEGSEVVFLQTPSPEFTLPAGLDLARLGEIGLRVAGLTPGDARRFAESLDWHSTLLVPIPATASSYRQVEIRGQHGLLVSTDATANHTARERWHHTGSQLMWAENGRVYVLLSSTVNDVDLLRMANSVQ
jgi:hypothetical protein